MELGMTVVYDEPVYFAEHIVGIIDPVRYFAFLHCFFGKFLGLSPDIFYLHARKCLFHVKKFTKTGGMRVFGTYDTDFEDFHFLIIFGEPLRCGVERRRQCQSRERCALTEFFYKCSSGTVSY